MHYAFFILHWAIHDGPLNDNFSSRDLQLPPYDSIISPAMVGFSYQIRKAWYI